MGSVVIDDAVVRGVAAVIGDVGGRSVWDLVGTPSGLGCVYTAYGLVLVTLRRQDAERKQMILGSLLGLIRNCRFSNLISRVGKWISSENKSGNQWKPDVSSSRAF